jgi:hypothetical protein
MQIMPTLTSAIEPYEQQLRNLKRITRVLHAIGNFKLYEELAPALPELQRIRDNQRTIIDLLLAHSTRFIIIFLSSSLSASDVT